MFVLWFRSFSVAGEHVRNCMRSCPTVKCAAVKQIRGRFRLFLLAPHGLGLLSLCFSWVGQPIKMNGLPYPLKYAYFDLKSSLISQSCLHWHPTSHQSLAFTSKFLHIVVLNPHYSPPLPIFSLRITVLGSLNVSSPPSHHPLLHYLTQTRRAGDTRVGQRAGAASQ